MNYLQSILVTICLIVAIVFLIKKYFFVSKKTTHGCGKDNCGC